jgi:hypothetical protein
VFGARLRITTLRGESGPGIELLEYLAPRDGRPLSPETRPNDLVYWNVVLIGPIDPVAQRLGAQAVATPGRELGFSQAAVVRDPDGHAMELVQP